MTLLSSEPLTAAEYRARPESTVRQHLIDGFLVQEPSPTDFHQTCTLNLAALLRGALKRSRAGTVHIAPFDVWLTDSVVVQPDVLFVSAERKPIIRRDGVHGGPDIVAEVLSPSNRSLVRRRKFALYAEHGVPEMWLVDPENETVEVYRFMLSRGKPVSVLRGAGFLASPLLPGIELPLPEVFER